MARTNHINLEFENKKTHAKSASKMQLESFVQELMEQGLDISSPEVSALISQKSNEIERALDEQLQLLERERQAQVSSI